MTTYGIKSSASNNNILTVGISNQQFTSEAKTPKIISTTLNSVAKNISVAASSTSTVTINHGLTYQPSFLLWYKDEDNNWHFADSMRFSLSTNNYLVVVDAKTDKQNLVIQFLNNDASNTRIVEYHYIIFEDQI